MILSKFQGELRHNFQSYVPLNSTKSMLPKCTNETQILKFTYTSFSPWFTHSSLNYLVGGPCSWRGCLFFKRSFAMPHVFFH